MDASAFLFQALNGLAGASSLFLVAAGLSLIFGVTRIVNFAHGSFFMLGLYVSYSLVAHMAPTWSQHIRAGAAYFLALLVAALLIGVLGALVEVVLLRRIYQAPELFQLLATFALVLVLQDGALWLWGAEDLLGPRAPGFEGAIDVLGRRFPTYDVLLIVLGPLLLLGLWWLMQRTRFGVLIRAATQDREMVSALGINPQHLFTAVFALGCALAGLGGALQLPREPANLSLDMATIGDAFVVVVVGGMGSIPGAYVAALLIAEIKALCIAIGTVEIAGVSFAFSKLTLVAEFVVMALVLLVRPWGLMGKPQSVTRHDNLDTQPMRLMSSRQQVLIVGVLLCCAAWPFFISDTSYLLVLAIDLLIATLFAASLHVLLGPAGMHSFGHAAYFGVGAYAAALAGVTRWQGDMSSEAALLCWHLLSASWWHCNTHCVVCGTLVGRVLGHADFGVCTNCVVHLFSVGRHSPEAATASRVCGLAIALQSKAAYYWLTLALSQLQALYALRRVLMSPLGYALRASRDSP